MKEELLEMLKELKEELENENTDMDDIRKQIIMNFMVLKDILKRTKEKTIVEATSEIIRSYDDSLAKCLEAGAKMDDEFNYAFTTKYINTILSLVANLFLVTDFAKDKDNLAFLKSKVRECLIYIDRL